MSTAKKAHSLKRACSTVNSLLVFYPDRSKASGSSRSVPQSTRRYTMALGDGIRRNLATVSKEERDLFIDAVKQLNQIFYSPTGSRTDFPAGHVSYWFKQDEIHQSTHVHHVPQFLPWHREMCKRFEALLRSVHPDLSLHYLDWNVDPSNMLDADGNVINLVASDFMGNA